jgi:hypothetical protein
MAQQANRPAGLIHPHGPKGVEPRKPSTQKTTGPANPHPTAVQKRMKGKP